MNKHCKNIAYICVLFIYNVLFGVIYQFLILFFLFRLYRKKETLSSLYQKLCPNFPLLFFKTRRFDIWFHAASVGELRSMDFLISNNINARHQVLITTTTLKSAEIVNAYDSKYVTHSFLPIDFLPLHLAFFWKNRAKKIIIADSEIWLTFFAVSSIFCVKIFLFNARMSHASRKKWEYVPHIFYSTLKSIAVILPQGRSELNFFSKFHNNVLYYGNLKMINLKFECKNLNEKIIQFPQKKVIAVVSTHDGEDALIIEQIVHFKEKFDIIYCPRHPHRAVDISKILLKYDIENSILSQNSARKSCLIVDSIGLLDSVFSVADVAIYGGSFLPHLKGHNIMEPASFGCKIITGNFVETFIEVIDEMKNHNAIIQCDACDLQNMVKTVMSGGKNQAIGMNAKKYIENNMPNIPQILEKLEEI